MLTLWRRLLSSFRHDQESREREEELRGHFELLVADNLRRGMDESAARREARQTLGVEWQINADCREHAGLPFVETLLQDLKYAVRQLRKAPLFTAVAVLTLALGIGANSAIFSVVDAVLLRPLPYPHPDQLVTLRGAQSRPDMDDIGKQARALQSIGGVWGYQFDLLGNGQPEEVQADLVSLDALVALGVPPLLGRTLTARDDVPGGARVVVLSEGFWRNRMGADPAVLGKTLRLSGNRYEIVGVMPSRLWLPHGGGQFSGGPELFVPMSVGYPEAAAARGLHAQLCILRLRATATRAQLQGELDAIAAQLSKAYPAENRERRFSIVDLRESVVGSVRLMMLVLFGAVALVLLIASVNFANLLLARAATRSHEAQIRAALGATPRRLVRQFLTESTLLSLIGGLTALLFAAGALRMLALVQPGELPRIESVAIDWRVLFFTLVISLLTGCLFGLVPLFQVVLPGARLGLQPGRTTAGPAPSSVRARQSLIVVQFAFALMLLCAAGLLLRSLAQLQSVDVGFDPEHLVTARLWLHAKKYDDISAQSRFYAQLDARLAQLPGAQSAALVTEVPLGGNRLPHNIVFKGRAPVAEGSEPDVLTNLVSPELFRTLGMKMLRGRPFDAADREGAPLVAVINDAMAREYFAGEDPIGKAVAYARMPERRWMTVVGVVSDIKEFGPDVPAEPVLYTPIQQKLEEWRRWSGIVVRGPDAGPLASGIKQAVWSIDPAVPVTKLMPMTDLMAATLAQRRFTALLLTLFAATALALAMIGIYGVIAYSVVQRTREIGVRMALGAQRRQVVWVVLRQALLLGAIGVALGTAGSFFASRALASMVFGVSAHDPATFAAVAMLLLAVALLASLLPAWRATRIDPSAALRAE